MIKKSYKYAVYTLCTLLLVLLLLVLFTQTKWFRQTIKDKAIALVEKELNLRLDLESIDGNFYNSITLNNLHAKLDSDSSSLLKIESLHLKYNLWDLWDKNIQVDTLILMGFNLSLEQYKDGKWNLSQIISKQKDTTSHKKSFPFSITVDELAIINSKASLDSRVKLLPDQVQNINLEATFFYHLKTIKTNLKLLSFHTESPDITFQSLSGQFTKDGQQLSLDSLCLKTGQSNINGDARYAKLENSSAKLNLAPINKDELKLFIPSLKLANTPHLKVDYNTAGDSTEVLLNLKIPNESITIAATLIHLDKYSKGETPSIPYNATLSFSRVKPESWWMMKPTKLILNGTTSISGDHLINYKEEININANLYRTSYQDLIFDTLSIRGSQKKDSINADINIYSKSGGIKGQVALQNTFTKPTYQASLQSQNFLLSDFISGQDTILLNSDIDIEGQNFNGDSININASINLKNSKAFRVPVDSAMLIVQLNKGLIQLYEGQFQVPGARILADGNYHLRTKKLSANAQLESDTLEFINNYSVPDISFQKVEGNFFINGQLDSLIAGGEIIANQFKGYSILSNTIQSQLSATITEEHFEAEADLESSQILAFGINIDTLVSQLSFSDKTLTSNAYIRSDSISSKLNSSIEFADSLNINMTQLEVNSPFANYYIADSLNTIHLFKKDISINNLIIHDHFSPDFELSASGRISNNNTENFDLNITQFPLNTLNKFDIIPETLSGSFSTSIELRGNPESPTLNSTFRIDDGIYDSLQIPDLKGDLKFDNQQLHASVSIPKFNEQIQLSFMAPIKAGFDSLGFQFEAPEYFETKLILDSINITEPIENHYKQITTSGHISSHILAKGTFDQPSFYGFLKLDKLKYKDEKYGIDVQDATIALNFDSNKVAIDTFIVKRDKGFLTIHGTAEFDSSMISGKIHSSTLEADAKKFYLTRHKDYEIIIDAKTFIKALDQKQEFGGKVKIIRSDFYLPALIDSGDDDDFDDVPILVEALSTDADSMNANTTNELDPAPLKKKQSNFMENLSGRLQLEIPRNTWLRSKEMKIEIWGDLEIEKSAAYFELFGEVGINRGHYILYGRKLDIKEGVIRFQGGEDIDPVLDFTASYVYRGSDKEKRELKLQVSERLSDPSISFTLDDSPIPDADAVSILVFGKTMDELSYAGQNGIVGSMGTNMVAQMVTSQLSKTIGTRFKLDMIEVNATENWQSAAFVVGKYITNDLFVIYQRGFGESEGDEITPETITLEYELNRILFFRLQSGSSKESGFDVILKFESNKD